MSSISDLFKHYILAEEPVTLEMYSEREITNLLASLRVLKSRYTKQLEDLGMESENLLAGKTIQHKIEPADDGAYKVTIFVAEDKRKSITQFRILE